MVVCENNYNFNPLLAAKWLQNIFQLHPTRRGASAKHNIS